LNSEQLDVKEKIYQSAIDQSRGGRLWLRAQRSNLPHSPIWDRPV